MSNFESAVISQVPEVDSFLVFCPAVGAALQGREATRERMLHAREEYLDKEPRASSFVLLVAPEDPSVCPSRLKSRAAERAKSLAQADEMAAAQVTDNQNNEQGSDGQTAA